MNNPSSPTEHLQVVNNILEDLLINYCVESFGIIHQVMFIDFIKDDDEVRLSFDCFIRISEFEKKLDMSEIEHAFICMLRVNLLKIESVKCNLSGELSLVFHDQTSITFLPDPNDDGGEPWQINTDLSVDKGGREIIASTSGLYAVW